MLSDRHTPAMTDFNPRSPHGERRSSGSPRHSARNFNPRSPHGERLVGMSLGSAVRHFNPRSPHGERRSLGQRCPYRFNFNPRSPHGERHASCACHARAQGFQSTLPARGATAAYLSNIASTLVFQSTLPARGATRHSAHSGCACKFQSTLPARGATLTPPPAPLTAALFQSTLPARGATRMWSASSMYWAISIHAPRTGSDCASEIALSVQHHFNPRSPHGERPASIRFLVDGTVFQSTLPARGATQSTTRNPKS